MHILERLWKTGKKIHERNKRMKKRKIINPDPTLHNNLMAFGFECDRGWYSLIEKCLDRIEDIMTKKYPDVDNFEITQVKEKLGELRIYTNLYFDETEDIVDECTKKSLRTCEVCGEPGELRYYHHWYKTLCNKHFGEWINPYRYYNNR